MTTRYLDRLFNPRSIAILGASERPANLGGMVLRNLMASGFTGQLMVVNRQDYGSVHGVPCVRRLSRLPGVPDLAIICTPPETVPRLVRQLGEMGVRVAIVMTGGMSRRFSRNGRPLMYSVRDAARKARVRILGPNTIGIMNPSAQVNATYAHMGVLEGKIGFVGQSGSIGSVVVDWAFARGVGFSHLLTLGDGVDIAHDDLIDYLAQDAGTRAILLHMEHIPHPARFISAVRAASRSKPVIAVKSGRYPQSEWLPTPVPEGLTSRDPVYEAALKRGGVLRVNGLDEMFDALESLSRMRKVRRDDLMIVANGVGPGVLAVDRLMHLQGELATPSEKTVKALGKLLPRYLSPGNPLDLGFDANPALYAQVLDLLAQDPQIGNVLVMYTPMLTQDSLQIADALIAAQQRHRLNVFTCWLGHSTVLEARDAFYRAGVPSFFSPEKAIKSFMHHVSHQRSQRLLQETPETTPERSTDRDHARGLIEGVRKSQRSQLTHQECARILTDYGVQTVPTRYCEDVDQVLETFDEWGGPVNLTLLHEMSGHPFLEERSGRGRYKSTVRRLNDPLALRQSGHMLMDQYQQHFPGSRFLGFALQRTDSHLGGVGFSVGITRDPVFGPLIVCGAAGARVTVMSDRQVALPPLNMVLARELLERTYMHRLLREYSLHPEADIRSVCQTLVTLSQMVADLPEIRGLEILPLLFNEQGAIACDMAMDLDEPAAMVIQPYPRELEAWVTLPRSGRKVLLRPVRAEDEPAHLELHRQQSAESLRYRFFHYRSHFSHDDIARMVQIDYDREMVFIADPEGEGRETLGTVRVWTDADNQQCEFAVMVRDDQRGEGLGRTLLEKMIAYCRSRGTREMVGTVLPENFPMLHLAERLGFGIHQNPEEGVMDLRLILNGPKPDPQPRESHLDDALPPV
ncbi:MAG: bifunctional acetate--CoA ligase family protein/GNAT family N-acetyltransferase [Oleiphilaceae bacterium]|nr:bifunctional acetate--CoA ligase family protein/GNAT family N-acetyltransferase [Oleiphilaceae bacterium]